MGASGSGLHQVDTSPITRRRSRSNARYRRLGRLGNWNRLGKHFVFAATVQVVPVGQISESFTAGLLKKPPQFTVRNGGRAMFKPS